MATNSVTAHSDALTALSRPSPAIQVLYAETSDEHELLVLFRRLSRCDQQAVMAAVRTLAAGNVNKSN
ncbi:hypothetical protein [Luteibacter sp. 3190]|uniref:hypothetical protein n=1 Tax=Luteibacter sp. 3190 TaxID=2817736 RepID=UPI002854B044|nr:hypothetical protein [Luteibacter sp. 3190]MDR6935483.1 hypothetical protein [Luteibacter sp. 3190]